MKDSLQQIESEASGCITFFVVIVFLLGFFCGLMFFDANIQQDDDVIHRIDTTNLRSANSRLWMQYMDLRISLMYMETGHTNYNHLHIYKQ